MLLGWPYSKIVEIKDKVLISVWKNTQATNFFKQPFWKIESILLSQKNGAQKSRKIQKKPKSSKADSEQKSPKNSTKSKKFTKAEADKVSQKKGSKKKLCDLKKNETEQEQVKTKRRCSKDLSKGAYKEEGNEDDVIETEGSDSESECEEVSKGKKAKKPGKRKSEKNSRNVSERNKEQSLR